MEQMLVWTFSNQRIQEIFPFKSHFLTDGLTISNRWWLIIWPVGIFTYLLKTLDFSANMWKN